jgi:hypothetical protein
MDKCSYCGSKDLYHCVWRGTSRQAFVIICELCINWNRFMMRPSDDRI